MFGRFTPVFAFFMSRVEADSMLPIWQQIPTALAFDGLTFLMKIVRSWVRVASALVSNENGK